MRGFAAFIVMVVIFVAGVFVGTELGILGKPNVITLEAEGDGVSPLYFKGDRIHWIDPFAPPKADGQPDDVKNVNYPTGAPCDNLDSNGICTIDKAPGTYTYSCIPACGDPGTNVGGGGPTLVIPGRGGDQTESFSFKMLLLEFSRFFVQEFFLPVPGKGVVVTPDKPDRRLPNPPATIITASCDANGLISAPPPPPLPLGSGVQWANFTKLGPDFKVTELGSDTDLNLACGADTLPSSHFNGHTKPCTLSPNYASPQVRYTIVDTSSATPACKAPAEGFTLQIAPASPR